MENILVDLAIHGYTISKIKEPLVRDIFYK